MTQVFFRRSNPKEVLVDRCGAVVNDLGTRLSTHVVQSFTNGRSLEVWFDCRSTLLRAPLPAACRYVATLPPPGDPRGLPLRACNPASSPPWTWVAQDP